MLEDWGEGGLSYDPAFYLCGTGRRLERLREIVGGRDTLILSHGPSISGLVNWEERFGALDVCIAAVNRFRVFETGFLARSARTVDVLLETHYKSVRQLADQILEFLERPGSNLFIANRWVMDRLGPSCPRRHEFERRFDEKLLYFGGQGGVRPATPGHPLRFVQGNSLSALVSIMAIAGARRICLFGADGGIPHDSTTSTHYGSEKTAFRLDITRDLHEAFRASLCADALEFGEIVETGLLAVEGLFGVKPPAIFNVSPSSRIDGFPKITYEKAWALLEAG